MFMRPIYHPRAAVAIRAGNGKPAPGCASRRVLNTRVIDALKQLNFEAVAVGPAS
jgi:hypothetical protein